MATGTIVNESIQEFLEKLKLSDKYTDLFITNGYLYVSDCYGITEETLKDIGITLPGHYRRILNKLPGCRVKKPHRSNRGSSMDLDLPVTDGCFETIDIPICTINNNASEDEKIHNVNVSVNSNYNENDTELLKDVRHSLADVKVSATSSGTAETPHESEKKEIALNNNLQRQTAVEDDPFFGTFQQTSGLVPEGNGVQERTSPTFDIAQSLSHFLLDFPDSFLPTGEMFTNDAESFVEDTLSNHYAHSDVSEEEFKAAFTEFSENRLAEQPDNRGGNVRTVSPPWPSPPPLPEVEMSFSSPPSVQSPGLCNDIPYANGVSDTYDHINVNGSGNVNSYAVTQPGQETESSNSITINTDDPYSKLKFETDMSSQPQNSQLQAESKSTYEVPVFRMLPPPDLTKTTPLYENITLFGEKSSENLYNSSEKQVTHNVAEQVEANPTVTIPALPTPIDMKTVRVIRLGGNDKANLRQDRLSYDDTSDSSLERPGSFDMFDTNNASGVTTESSIENLYNVCNDGTASVARAASELLHQNEAEASLPRSSGSMPAISDDSRFKLKNAVQQRRNAPRRSMDSILTDSAVVGTNFKEEDGRKDDDKDVYESIGDPLLPGVESKFHKGSTGASLLRANNIRTRIGLQRRHINQQRPLSAIVDSFRSSQFERKSSSEESLENLIEGSTEKNHRRSNKRATSTSGSKRGSATLSQQYDLIDAPFDENNKSKSMENLIFETAQRKTKKGWLSKHSGNESRAMWRKRWVEFDGNELACYENEKVELTRAIIPLDVILRVQVSQSDLRVFYILAKGGRKYVFNAENTIERTLWTSTILAAKVMNEKENQGQFKPGGCMYMPYKEGFMRMDGSRQKNYLATKGEIFAYYKTSNEFNFGQPVAKLSMKIATVKEVDKKKFQIIFPFRTFTLTADSEEEKRSWVEALNDAIAEGLSDYKVLKEIWALEVNRQCADCGREEPDWASINLGIVVCKHCAGVHRNLGVHNSNVRSLKMDVKIWNDNMKRLLSGIGNDVANSFWGSRLKSNEFITDMADKKQRAWHITSKYLEMQYLEAHTYVGNQELLNQALINAVQDDNLREAYTLIFSGADPNCGTGKKQAKTPYLLAKHLRYEVMAEFLYQNGATDEVSPRGYVTDRSSSLQKKNSIPKTKAKPPVMLKEYLYKYGGDFKSASEDNKPSRGLGLIRSALQQGEFQKRMCVLDNNYFKYYDPEKTTVLKDEVDCSELICIGLSQPEVATKAGYQHCFEVSRSTGRTYLFSAESKEVAKKWISGLMQAIVPPHVQNAMEGDAEYDRIGKLWMKSQHWTKKNSEWTSTWCRLKGKYMHYFHFDSRTMERIDLRKLVQLGPDLTQDGSTVGIGSGQSTKEAIPTFMLVFRERSYYLRSDTKSDSELWLAAIRKADSDCGSNLVNQQLTFEGVPIILEKCTTYVEQFGLTTRGIYRLSGTHSKTTQLLNDFTQNARETQMREVDLSVHDVANALKRWFKSLPGSLLTEHLHELWINTSQIKPELHDKKLECYKQLIEKLPDINRNTLKVLLMHLNNVASHEKENEMKLHNLAIVFGPTLMEPQGAEDGKLFLGQTSQEIACIEDLLQYYEWLFDVTEIDREKERLMLKAKEKISMATQQQNMLTTLDYDMMVPIYINSKEEKCVNYKVNMTAGELISQICSAHGYPSSSWGLFEVISDGDAERPLNYSEHVLSIIKTWEMPSTNYLVAKLDYVRSILLWIKRPNIPGVEVLFEGQVKVYDAKKKWMKMTAILKEVDGVMSISYAKSQEGNTSVRDVATGNWRRRSSRIHHFTRRTQGTFDAKGAINISLAPYHVYFGVDRKTKPPMSRSFGFTLACRNEVTKYFLVDNEKNLNKWIGNILKSKYPQGFTPPASPMVNRNIDSSLHSSEPRHASRSSSRPTQSSQYVGEAARVVAKQRISSNSSDDAFKENALGYYNRDDTEVGASSPKHLSVSSSTSRHGSLSSIPGEQADGSDVPNNLPVEQTHGRFRRKKMHSELLSAVRRRKE